MKSATLVLAESFLRKANLSAAAIAVLVGVSASTMRAALRGEGGLSSQKEADILSMASRVAQFREALEPLKLSELSDLQALLTSGKTPEEVRMLVGAIFQDE